VGRAKNFHRATTLAVFIAHLPQIAKNVLTDTNPYMFTILLIGLIHKSIMPMGVFRIINQMEFNNTVVNLAKCKIVKNALMMQQDAINVIRDILNSQVGIALPAIIIV
jgi:hypothetical protein